MASLMYFEVRDLLAKLAAEELAIRERARGMLRRDVKLIGRYMDSEGRPMCIIAQILSRLQPENWAEFVTLVKPEQEGSVFAHYNHIEVNQLFGKGFFECRSGELGLKLWRLQRVQDSGKPWWYELEKDWSAWA